MPHYYSNSPTVQTKIKVLRGARYFVNGAVADAKLRTFSAVEQVRLRHTANCTPKLKLTVSASIFRWKRIGSYMLAHGSSS